MPSEGDLNSLKAKGGVLWSEVCCMQLLWINCCILYSSSLLKLSLLLRAKFEYHYFVVTRFQFGLSRKKRLMLNAKI